VTTERKVKQAYDEGVGWIAAHFPTALLILDGQGDHHPVPSSSALLS